jgi:hypothetical protein
LTGQGTAVDGIDRGFPGYDAGFPGLCGAAIRPDVLLGQPQGLRVSVYGVIAGIVTASLLTQFLGSMLYGAQETDTLTFALVIERRGSIRSGRCVPIKRA